MSRYSKTLPHILIREEEEAEKFLGKIEDVNSMLSQLMSKDDQEVSDAKKERCSTSFNIKPNLLVYWLLNYILFPAGCGG